MDHPSRTNRTNDTERRLAQLRTAVIELAQAQKALQSDVQELFAEVAQALDVVTASLEDLVPEDERDGWSDQTGLMGRACELQSVVRLFRASLADLNRRVATDAPVRPVHVA